MARQKRQTRKQKVNESEENTLKQKSPLQALTSKQKTYIDFIHSKDIVIATGLPGTSKTYIPSRIACEYLRQGLSKKIVICRPATSKSKSLGAFSGDKNEKMLNWIGPVKEALREELTQGDLEYKLEREVIQLQPLETIKGASFKKCFVIVDEAEDCTYHEIKTLLTRVGKGTKMVLCGDINQTDLKNSGLSQVLEALQYGPAYDKVAHIHFGDYDDVVRSPVVKALVETFVIYEESK